MLLQSQQNTTTNLIGPKFWTNDDNQISSHMRLTKPNKRQQENITNLETRSYVIFVFCWLMYAYLGGLQQQSSSGTCSIFFNKSQKGPAPPVLLKKRVVLFFSVLLGPGWFSRSGGCPLSLAGWPAGRCTGNEESR